MLLSKDFLFEKIALSGITLSIREHIKGYMMIKVVLPDGNKFELEDNTLVFDLAGKISEGLQRASVAAVVNGELCDIQTVLNNKDEVKIITSRDEESLGILRHTTAHVMAQAVQNLFPQAKIAIGPNIENGFYYDFDIPEHNLVPDDLFRIETEMKKIIKQEQTFERFEIPNIDAQIEEFKTKGEIYKAELLEEHRDENPTLYVNKDKEGNIIWNDFCRGPHLPSTKLIKAFKLLSVAGAYWRGDEKNKMLQRIYATAFWKKDELKEYLNRLEEAEKRDHRKLGTQLDLFSVRDEVGSGLPLWHPALGVVRQMVEDYWRLEHRRRDYDIVHTPHIAKSKLWDISGHSDHYKDNMYYLQVDEQDYVLKPMNCPFHILIYQENRHSYRSLPIRLAEMGTVYRHERSGALHGLTRVRCFTQDDAHIFCTNEQFVEEVNSIIDFVDDTLKVFGFEYEVELSTRPDDYTGTIEIWNKAESGLKEALESKNINYEINEADGAFYGPKIDFKIKDAIGRTWQGATIQLDFNLPIRFDLKYTEKDGSLQHPVMIHRVIFGSMERFVGLLIEHYAGAFPAWLSPDQVAIVPILEKHADYAREVYKKLRKLDIRVKLDDSSEHMKVKIKEAQLKKTPYILVVGDKEQETNSVAIRKRGTGMIGVKPVDEFIRLLEKEITSKGAEEIQ